MCDLETIGLPNARLTSSWAWAFLRVATSYGDEINVDDIRLDERAREPLIDRDETFWTRLICSCLAHPDELDQHEDNHRSAVFRTVPASKDT
jgi:hypothetical protein